jgi:hypothetical protein
VATEREDISFLTWFGRTSVGSILLDAWRWISRAQAKEAEAIRKSGLFDVAWYLERYPDVASYPHDRIDHYVKFGAWEGRDPLPLFDSMWYRAAYPEVGKSGMTPLGHFLVIGAKKGYDPNPLFLTSWYVANNPDLPSQNVNPLRHYIEHATEPGRNPNPLFDSVWYLSRHRDVRNAGENPLAHYLRRGIAEFRDPHPSFHTEWYLEHYEQVHASGLDALEHYLTVGVFEGYRPGPDANEVSAGLRPYARRPKRAGDFDSQRARIADLGVASAELRTIDVMEWRLARDRRTKAIPRYTGQIGVFVHIFYDDLADEIAARLVAVPYQFKVYVSTNNMDKKEKIESSFRQFGIEAIVKVFPNRGWDIAPFALGFADEIRNHEICLKLHAKRSRQSAISFGVRWRNFLMSGLLGDARNISRIVESFVTHPKLGILMLPHWRGISRGASKIGPNFEAMRSVLRRAGLAISVEQRFEFPSGSMFWFRSDALASLLKLGLTWEDFYNCRPRDVDGTIAHGIERCMLWFAADAGYRWAFLSKPSPARIWRAKRSVRRQQKRQADVGRARAH